MSELPLSVYRAIFNSSPIGKLILSPSLTILDANDVLLKITSHRRESVVGKNLFEVFPDTNNPDTNNNGSSDTGVLRQSLTRVLQSGEQDAIAIVRYPVQVRGDRGQAELRERYWSTVSTPIFDSDGNLTCISHNVMDVTDFAEATTPPAKEEIQARFDLSEAGLFTHAQLVQRLNRALTNERIRLSHLFDRSPSFVFFTHGKDHVTDQANEAFMDLVGPRKIVGIPMRDALPELGGQGFFDLLDHVYESGEGYVGQAVRVLIREPESANVVEHYVDLVYQPIVHVDGTIIGICGQGNDITDKKRIEDNLRENEKRWKLALEASEGGVWDINLKTGHASYSETWKSMLGYDDGNLPPTVDAWKSLVHPDDVEQLEADIKNQLAQGEKTFSSQYRMRCHGGEWKWVLSRGAVVEWDEAGKPLRMIGTIHDFTESKRSEYEIWRQANFDPLTGLPNRRLFRDRLEQNITKVDRSGLSVCLLFIDLDRFKEVNDLLGHSAGDLLLRKAAERICHCVRASDTVARLGGDEFTVILPDLEGEGHCEDVACKIIDVLAEPFYLKGERAFISGSIGITFYPSDANDSDELIRNADQAMYSAKKSGRNQFRFFTRSMQEHAHSRLRLRRDLRDALGNGEFQVLYQPIVDFHTGRVTKAEALLRWIHPKLGVVAPEEFIPLAEEAGLINEIGDWVFRCAAYCSQHWAEKCGRPFEISVNRSPVQFMTKSETLNWPEYLETLGSPHSHISVEITEGILVDASPRVANTLLSFRDAGISVAIDDFGTGYSSMAYLKKFDIDYLKIDQSFVQDLENSTGSQTIAKSMIVMAHELGLKVIAEGIESRAQADILQVAGCDYGQGYLFSRPMPSAAFEQLLVKH